MPNPSRTRLMARIVGPFLLILGAALALRAHTLRPLLDAFLRDSPLLLLTGFVTLAVGLVMITAHNSWGNPPAVVISLLGWLTTLRGALLLLAPDVVVKLASAALQSSIFPLLAGAVTALIGLWLAFAGWSARANL